jgi:hypothetical protein
MKIRAPHLSRRQWLRAAGATAVATPFLRGGARAQTAGSPLRLVLWPMMNGAESQYFWPNPGNFAALSTIMEPLKDYARQLTFIRGVDVDGSVNHFAVRSIFSGFPVASYDTADPNVKSADQVIADHLAAGSPTPLKSLHLGVIPADSINYYQRYGRSTLFFSPKPVDYEANPVTAFDRVFGGGPTAAPPPAAMGGDFTSDALDLLEAEIGELGGRLKDSSRELNKLTQHKEALRSLRPSAMSPIATPGMPPASQGGQLASVEKLRPLLQGNAKDAYKHAYFSDIFDAQVDILARALVTGLTRVGTLQAGSADGNAIVPVDRGYPHHNTSHGTQAIFSQCQRWYMTKLQRLADALNVPDPLDPTGKTVLHNTAVVVMAECLPVSHSSDSVPTFVLGNAGGLLRSGTLITKSGISNKTVLATILQIFGAPAAPQFGSTTLAELRA